MIDSIDAAGSGSVRFAPNSGLERLRTAFRFILGTVLLSYYGMANLFPSAHFPRPTLAQVARPLAEHTPAEAYAAYLGFLPQYVVFIGIGQVLAGGLLYFRRTSMLGSLMALGILTNMIFVSFGYHLPDLPLVMALWGMSLVIVAPDARRLIRALVLERPTLAEPRFPESHRARRIGWGAAGYLALVALVSAGYWTGVAGSRPGPSPLEGIYAVDSMVVDGLALPPVLTDSLRWQTLMVTSRDSAAVQLMTDSLRSYGLQVDPIAQTLRLTSVSIPTTEGRAMEFRYVRPTASALQLNGTVGGQTIRVALHRLEPIQRYPILTPLATIFAQDRRLRPPEKVPSTFPAFIASYEFRQQTQRQSMMRVAASLKQLFPFF